MVLLLGSYQDACEGGRDGTEHEERQTDKPGSRAPRRGELWRQGSYAPLERALNALRREDTALRLQAGRDWPWPGRYWSTWVFFVIGDDNWKRQVNAERGLRWLLKILPETIYVPQDISENASYAPTVAEQYTRRAR